jgi:hypothetical protein
MGGMLRWLLSVTRTTPERPTVVLTGRMTLAMVRLREGGERRGCLVAGRAAREVALVSRGPIGKAAAKGTENLRVHAAWSRRANDEADITSAPNDVLTGAQHTGTLRTADGHK